MTLSKTELREISEAATARAVGQLKVAQAVERLDAADLFELFASARAARLGSNLAEASPSPARPNTALAELTESDLDDQLAGLVNEVQEASGRPQLARTAVAPAQSQRVHEIHETALNTQGGSTLVGQTNWTFDANGKPIADGVLKIDRSEQIAEAQLGLLGFPPAA